MSAEDYCELCDLPKSTCVHGNPPPPTPPRASARTSPPGAPSSTPRAARAPRTPRATRPAAPSVPTRQVPRRWTPPEAFKPAIVVVLTEAGGELEQDELFARLEAQLGDRLTAADHELTPEGELRWRYAARRARQALIAEGSMTKQKPGVWSLA